jgi:glycosyltransferase involved in cell wall biosynthesis
MKAIIGNSRAIVAELASEGAPRDRLALVPNGVTLERFASLPAQAIARERLELAKDTTVAVMVANLNHHKGHADVIDALGGLGHRLPRDFVLVCAGRDDGIGRELAERARGLGIGDRVRFIGPRNDVPAVLAAADFAISASHQEGSSNAVLEAMATGLPVIGTATGGTPEAVTDGVHGRLVPPQTPSAMAEAIAQLAAAPALRRAMGERAAAKIRSEYAMEACVDRYVAIYGAVLGDAPLPASVRA